MEKFGFLFSILKILIALSGISLCFWQLFKWAARKDSSALKNVVIYLFSTAAIIIALTVLQFALA